MRLFGAEPLYAAAVRWPVSRFVLVNRMSRPGVSFYENQKSWIGIVALCYEKTRTLIMGYMGYRDFKEDSTLQLYHGHSGRRNDLSRRYHR